MILQLGVSGYQSLDRSNGSVDEDRVQNAGKVHKYGAYEEKYIYNPQFFALILSGLKHVHDKRAQLSEEGWSDR